MSNVKTIKVGQMPGRINEFAVTIGQKVEEVLALAQLDATGFEVKVDGTKVDPSTAVVTESTSLILLSKMVKGNATVRVGQMPGRINEFALEPTTTVAEAIALAELDATGYEVKLDGNKVTDLNQPIGSTSLILLSKMVKGNTRTVRIGVMPGRINEYAIDPSTSVKEALEMAQLDTTGFEVKLDGNKVTDLNQSVGEANLILLAKQVKGN